MTFHFCTKKLPLAWFEIERVFLGKETCHTCQHVTQRLISLKKALRIRIYLFLKVSLCRGPCRQKNIWWVCNIDIWNRMTGTKRVHFARQRKNKEESIFMRVNARVKILKKNRPRVHFLSPSIRQEVQQQTSRLLGKVSPRLGIKVSVTRFDVIASFDGFWGLRDALFWTFDAMRQIEFFYVILKFDILKIFWPET